MLININELSRDQFSRILGPEHGSERDGSRVVLGMIGSPNYCVKVDGDTLKVEGSDDFRRAIEAAYEAKKQPSSGFGSMPMTKQSRDPEPVLSRLMPPTDITSATKVHLPIDVYQSARLPGLKAAGSVADDMTYGDMSAEEIRQIPTFMGSNMFDLRDPEQSNPRNHFMNLRAMGKLFSSGDMQAVILALIAKFEKSEGGEFQDPRLTQAVRRHPNTQRFTQSLTKQVNDYIKAQKGEINGTKLQNWMESYSNSLRLPAFNTKPGITDMRGDLFSGLTMAVNDVWSGKAQIISFDRFGDYYKGKIRVTFYDHFGLDYSDVGPDNTGVIKPYGLVAGFRSWFILQHYKAFAYKPVMTIMEMDFPFEGTL